MSAEPVVIELEGGSGTKPELAFHEFHSVDPSLQPGVIGGGKIESAARKDIDSARDGEDELLVTDDKGTTTSPHSWITLLTLDYYQSFFDVTTSQVGNRVLAGMIPLRYNLVDVLRPNPDLYGPFWLCMTLIFTIAISGNIASLFREREGWEFHFHEVTVVGTAVYTYTWVVPAVLWGMLWWRGSRIRYTLLELLSIYGYCIAAFIPVTMLWVINSETLRWSLLALGAGLSGMVLVLALWKPLKTDSRKLAVGTLVVVFLMHIGLAIGFKFYYFSTSLAPHKDTTYATTLPPSTGATAPSQA